MHCGKLPQKYHQVTDTSTLVPSSYVQRLDDITRIELVNISNVSRAQFSSSIIHLPLWGPGQAVRTARFIKILSFLPRNAGLTSAIQASPSAVPTLSSPSQTARRTTPRNMRVFYARLRVRRLT